ncbi:MAG: FHA domain-containing protein [Gammaproteobacteria bacterium]
MVMIAIDLNDAAITAVGPAGLELDDPGYVPGYAAAIDGRVLFGADAWHQSRLHPRSTTNRYWREFSEQPLSRPFATFTTSADLVHAHLEKLLSAFSSIPSEVLFVVPAYWTTAQLGLLLGVAEELALPVRGLVAGAVAATRCEYVDQLLLDVDASLHGTTITRLEQKERVALGERWAVDDVGVIRLERVCAGFIAERFLQMTRFDPLHDARSEQYLYDHLDAWLRDLHRQEEIAVAIESGGNEFRATIRCDELSALVADAFEPTARQLRTAVGADRAAAIQLSSRLAAFPGVVDALTRLPQASVFVMDPAAAALGALQRADRFAPTAAGVGLTTVLPWDRPRVRPDKPASQPADVSAIVAPTHLLHQGCVYRLGASAFSIGAELADGESGLRIRPAPSGVSRRHCSIRRGENGLELVDHSRFGTRLNGHPIDDAVLLQAGDVIGIGSPPLHLHLVREVGAGNRGHGA